MIKYKKRQEIRNNPGRLVRVIWAGMGALEDTSFSGDINAGYPIVAGGAGHYQCLQTSEEGCVSDIACDHASAIESRVSENDTIEFILQKDLLAQMTEGGNGGFSVVSQMRVNSWTNKQYLQRELVEGHEKDLIWYLRELKRQGHPRIEELVEKSYQGVQHDFDNLGEERPRVKRLLIEFLRPEKVISEYL
jgi:hypothetical protein